VSTEDVKLVQDLYRLVVAIYHDKYDGDERKRKRQLIGMDALYEACRL
jgi:hypothetical protein